MATTLRKRRVFTAAERQDYVDRFARSGLTQAEFCRRAKLHPMTFSLWYRTVRPVTPGFAEVEVGAAAPAVMGGVAILHLTAGRKLEVALGSEAVWHGLGILLKSLQA